MCLTSKGKGKQWAAPAPLRDTDGSSHSTRDELRLYTSLFSSEMESPFHTRHSGFEILNYYSISLVFHMVLLWFTVLKNFQ